MSKKKEVSVEQSIISFGDANAKDLFLTILDEYSSGVVQIMNDMSSVRGYGNGDAKIEVLGDEVRVYLKDKDKGSVLTKDGFLQHKSLKGGEKYMFIKEGKPGIFTKSGEGVADVFLGYSADVPTMISELSKSEDIASLIESI